MSTKKKSYKVVLNVQAEAQLEEHIAFPAKVSLPAAKTQRAEILVRAKRLAKMPYCYPVYITEETIREYRKIVIDRYIVLYTIDEENSIVYVEYVWDTRMANAL